MLHLGLCRLGLCSLGVLYVTFGVMLLGITVCRIQDYVTFGIPLFGIVSLLLMSLGLMLFGIMLFSILSVYRLPVVVIHMLALLPKFLIGAGVCVCVSVCVCVWRKTFSAFCKSIKTFIREMSPLLLLPRPPGKLWGRVEWFCTFLDFLNWHIAVDQKYC